MVHKLLTNIRTAPILWVLVALALLFGLYAVQAGAQAWWASEPQPAPRAAVQVFFTTPALVSPDVPQRRRASPLVQSFVTDIQAARRTIDLAVFDLDLDDVTEALIQAQRRGVTVRVVLDSVNLVTPEVAERAGKLQRAGAYVGFDRREPFMHHKFMIVDQAVTWTGSWNITENDTFRNNNNMVRIASPAIAAQYRHEMEGLTAGRFDSGVRRRGRQSAVQAGVTHVTPIFSPGGGAQQVLVGLLREARRSIRFLSFTYTSEAIAAAMADRLSVGVVVEGVIDAQSARGSGSQFKRLQGAGADVVEDGNCYLLHHKVIIIDESIVVTGSYNFTNSAERDNNENLLILDDPQIAGLYLGEFRRVFEQAHTPQRCN
jgi:phosphatidylserine/phosphatidylglycerophosphate/cardiolipin synthase-like enzyme